MEKKRTKEDKKRLEKALMEEKEELAEKKKREGTETVRD